MSEKKVYTVGRQAEVRLFEKLVSGDEPLPVLNIYGPGGIGKTIVGRKMREFATGRETPLAFIDGDRQELTPYRILRQIGNDLTVNEIVEEALSSFNK